MIAQRAVQRRRPLQRYLSFALVGLMMLPTVGFARPVPPVSVIAAPQSPEQQREAILSAIDASIVAGRLAGAADMIGRALVTDPSPQLQLRSAELALAGGDIAGAAAQFQDLAGQPDVSAQAQQGLGIARLRQGNATAAKIALDAALAIDPRLARAWNARAVIADQQRDWVAADKAYGEAIAIDPRSVQALTNRGYSMVMRGRYAEAEPDLAAAIALDPKLPTARTNLRFAQAMQGRYRDAFAGSTRETLATDLNTVGFAAMARGDRDTAETYFNRSLALNTRFDHVAWANLQYLQTAGRARLDTSDAGIAAAQAAILHPPQAAPRPSPRARR